MTRPSESKTRSVAAIGNGRVIPGKRSETRDPVSYHSRSVAAIGNGRVILREAAGRFEGSAERTEILRFAQDDRRSDAGLLRSRERAFLARARLKALT